MAETSELVIAAVSVIGAGVGFVKWTQSMISKVQAANTTLALAADDRAASAQAEIVKSRQDFTGVLRQVEQNHAKIHDQTMTALDRIEKACAARSDEDRKTIMGLLGLEKTETGSFRWKDGKPRA